MAKQMMISEILGNMEPKKLQELLCLPTPPKGGDAISPWELPGESLDNFSYDELREALNIIGDKAWTEASGGVTLDTIGTIGKIGPDFVSTAAPVHSGKWIDIGLDS